jgi:hypothetical protein
MYTKYFENVLKIHKNVLKLKIGNTCNKTCTCTCTNNSTGTINLIILALVLIHMLVHIHILVLVPVIIKTVYLVEKTRIEVTVFSA